MTNTEYLTTSRRPMPNVDENGDPTTITERDIENPDFMFEADIIAEEEYRREEWRAAFALYN